MDFELSEVKQAQHVSNAELQEILHLVYVQGGFTGPARAMEIFEPNRVRERGQLFIAREKQSHGLAGMIILVAPSSPASHSNEAEIHLMAVKPEFRRHGLGRRLITMAMDEARRQGHAKLLLRTQPTMTAAHNLYESCGFEHIDSMIRDNIEFKIYLRQL